jgi:sugar O-acyltransferase (sialic acid O-acetyltransferase NeuD family)
MKTLYILGASGFAKEVYGMLKTLNTYEIVAFVDTKKQPSISIFGDDIPVISEEDLLEKENPSSTLLAMGIGDPKILTKLAEKFKNFTFPNIIHPTAIIDEREVHLGKGNIITAGVIFTVCINVGDFNIFNLSATVGHDCSIKNCNIINPNVNISGNVFIGNANLLGVGSVILQNKNIGDNCIIGAASLVTKDVIDNATVIGIPAKQMSAK